MKILVRNFFTRESHLLGKTPREMERLIGYHEGRMALGARVFALRKLPACDEFAVAGDTGQPRDVDEAAEADRDCDDGGRASRAEVRASWSLEGPGRLVKVMPNVPHDPAMPDHLEYPPGEGIEQWLLLVPVPARLVCELGPDEPYRP